MQQTFVSLFAILLFTVIVSVQNVCGHGSHQHMKTSHQHYFPKVDDRKPEKVHSVLEEKKMIQDHDHLIEDLKGVYTEDQIARMSPEELGFHYFKMHDYDDNNRLDGTEIMAAISHILPHDDDLDLGKLGEGHVLTPDERHRLQQARQRRDDQLYLFTRMIDQMFIDQDKDKDGFINYREFSSTR